MNLLHFQRDLPGVEPEAVFHILDFPVSSSFLLSLLIVVLIAIFAYFVTRTFKTRPGRFQNFIEVIYEGITDFIAQIVGESKKAQFMFPIISTLFVYIGLSNLIGFIPGLTSFTYNGEGFFRTPTSDFNTTFGLALAMIVLLQIVSIKEWGVLGYIGRFLKFKEIYLGFRKGLKDGFLAMIEFFIGILDIISELAKIVSLSLRLFGNIYAGELLAILIIGALAYVLPSLWMGLNLLFAIVQTVVFGSLVAAYYTMVVKPEGE
jgi:F-type H+-transporting ATPase subunit a